MNRFASSRLKSAINSLLESQKNVALCLYVVCLISPMCDFFIPVQMTKKIVDASTIFTTKRNIRKNLCIVQHNMDPVLAVSLFVWLVLWLYALFFSTVHLVCLQSIRFAFVFFSRHDDKKKETQNTQKVEEKKEPLTLWCQYMSCRLYSSALAQSTILGK